MHAQTRPPLTRVAVSPTEAAEMLGVTRQTIYALIAHNKIRRYHAGRRALIPIGDVLALVGGGDHAPAA